MALAAFVGSMVGDRIASAITPRGAIIAASLLSAASYVAMIALSGLAAAFVASIAVGGFAMGIMISVVPTIVVNRARHDAVAVVSGLNNTARTAAGAAAGAVFSTILATFIIDGTGTGDTAAVSSFTGYVVVWIVCAALSLSCAVLALWLPRGQRSAASESAAADADAVTAIA